MTDKPTTLIEFPCHFPIKIMGKKTLAFAEDIVAITRKHFPDISDEAIRQQTSKQGNYLAFTVTVYVENQAALDAFYQELTTHPDMKMVL